MTTLKERAAKAMLVNDRYDLERLDHYEVNPYAEYLSNAEAALAAIAEPSEAMINAMWKVYAAPRQYQDLMLEFWKAAHAAMMAEEDSGKCS